MIEDECNPGFPRIKDLINERGSKIGESLRHWDDLIRAEAALGNEKASYPLLLLAF